MAMQESQVTTLTPGRESALEMEGVSLRRANLWLDAWRRLIRNWLAIAGLIGVIALILIAVFADQLMRNGGYARQHLADHGVSPNSQYWFGTDLLGRDVYSRVVYGCRIAMEVGLLTMFFATTIGVTIGSIAGFYSGQTDNLLMRGVDIIYAIPTLFFAILVMEALGRSVPHMIIALSLTSWPIMTRLTRAQMLSLREKEYIKAARLSGGRSWQIILRHLLPNSMTPIIVAITFGIPTAIFTEATLSLFGIGVNPPIPSWGQMVSESVREFRSYWWLAFFPATALALTMLSFTFLGDGIRDALDPRANN
ncbi:MAG TPA: ABC transporter permease [Dehalococcoidia bacterium]|jgi:ABC-type dipeptide/oligopeptide/nickel transport system permease subunit